MSLTPEAQERLLARVNALESAIREYADHQSWRCGWPDRYPHDPDCPCGLVATLARLGLADALEPYTAPVEDGDRSFIGEVE